MRLKNYLNKRFIQKRLCKVIIPYYITFLTRRKFFRIKYKNRNIRLTSLVFDEDIRYHHFHSYYRAKDNFSKNKWEQKSIDLSSDASLYIDIGGYNGVFGLLAAKSNSDIKVHIFEPNLLSAYIIYSNITLNNLNNVILHHVAVGNINRLVPFKINKNGSRVDFSLNHPDVMVNCMTFDTLIESLTDKDFTNVVVKIDAEGFEKQCLEGMKEFINKCKSLHMLLTIHSEIIGPINNYTEQDFFKTAENLNLKVIDSERFGDGVELYLQKI